MSWCRSFVIDGLNEIELIGGLQPLFSCSIYNFWENNDLIIIIVVTVRDRYIICNLRICAEAASRLY